MFIRLERENEAFLFEAKSAVRENCLFYRFFTDHYYLLALCSATESDNNLFVFHAHLFLLA